MGFLQVGPQYYPPRYKGAQIIMRGPHGYRFAGDPRTTETGRFQWWNEQLASEGGYEGSWQPQQKILGVMGMGNPVVDWLADKLTPFVAGGASPTTYDSSRAQTAGGTDPNLKAALTVSVRGFVSEVSKGRYTEDQLRSARSQLRESIMRAGRWTDRGRAPTGQEYVSQPDLLAMLERAHLAQLSTQVREDGRPMVSPSAIDPRTGRARIDDHVDAAKREFGREFQRGLPEGLGSVKNKVLLAAAAAVVLYGASKGLGLGLAARKSRR